MTLVIRACSMCSLDARQDGQPVTDEQTVEVLGRAGVEVSDRLCPSHAAAYEAMVEDYLQRTVSRREGPVASCAREKSGTEGPGTVWGSPGPSQED